MIISLILAFISTNLDDIFVLMVLFLQVENRKSVMRVVLGQYIGVGVLVILSVVGALGTQLIPERFIGLSGIVPLLLGIRMLCKNKYDNEEEQTIDAQISLWSVALLTITNGADNIGVYIPLFSTYSLKEFVVMVIVFVIFIAVWCYIVYTLTSYPYIKEKLSKYKNILVPLVFIAIGLMIIGENYLPL